MEFPSKLRVGSLLIFPSQGQSKVSDLARRTVRFGVKKDTVIPDTEIMVIPYAAQHLVKIMPGTELEDFLKLAGTLVPVPTSQIQQPDSLWPGKRIAEELLEVGVGRRIEFALSRTRTVRRSSQSASEERLKPEEHVASIEATAIRSQSGVITLVDDVVTRGSTMVACAALIQQLMPGATVQGLALARVDRDSDLSDINEMPKPKVETITRYEKSGKLWRE